MFFRTYSQSFIKKKFRLDFLKKNNLSLKIFLGINIIFWTDYSTSLFYSLKRSILLFIFPILDFISVFQDNISLIQYIKLNQEERVHLKTLENRYEALKNQHDKLQIEVQDLREILKSPAPITSTACIANVIGLHSTQTTMRITINKGSDDGLREGQVVIAPKGLVGQISDVWPKYSTIKTILDQSLKIPSQVLSTKEKGMVMHYSQETLILKYLEIKSPPEIGQTVYTTKFQNIYPENLVIGKIIGFEKDAPLIKPAVDVSRLDYVMILK